MMLTLTGCVKNTSGIPCEALTEVYYTSIEPETAEIKVLLNNAVISDACK